MVKIYREILPDYDKIKKRIFVTHADVDHCGLLGLFDEIYASGLTKDCLAAEEKGENGFREQNPLHKPYVNICKTLTLYNPAESEKIVTIGESRYDQESVLEQIGFFDFGELHFVVYQGKGGHLPGETVLIDYEHKITFTGDIYVNVHGMTPEQAEYNKYAPVLMTSVDTDPKLCAEERNAMMQRLGVCECKIFGAHGQMKEYSLRVE